MDMLKKSRIIIKKEVLPAIAEMISKNFRRDQKDFSAFFPKLDQKFFNRFLSHIKEVKRLPNPIIVTRELFHYIEEMHDYLISIAPLLDKNVISTNEENNHPIHDIITSIRNRIQRNDISGTLIHLEELIGEVTAIRDETGDRFFTPEVLNNLISLRDNLAEDHSTIKSLLKKRSYIVDNNEKVRDQLREEIQRISKAGKNMYRMMKPDKIKDYDISELILRRKHMFNDR